MPFHFLPCMVLRSGSSPDQGAIFLSNNLIHTTMTTFEKLKLVPDTIPIISTIGNQSVRSSFPCGCEVIFHKYAKTGNSAEADADKKFFITICKQHNIPNS